MKRASALIGAIIAVSISAMALSQPAFAADSTTDAKTVVLEDGSTASLLFQKGVTQSYIKEVETSADGNMRMVPDEAFSGKQLVKKADGTCLFISQVQTLNLVLINDIPFEQVTTTRSSKPASCNL